MFSLGDGHEFGWIWYQGRAVGLHEHHDYEKLARGEFPHCVGGGYIAWEVTPVTPMANHRLVVGGPGTEEYVTIEPSLWHRAKFDEHGNPNRDPELNSPDFGCHGHIRNGLWVPVQG